MGHNDTVISSFGHQAAKFAAYHMSKAEYTNYLIHRIAPTGEETALEVAAGTCICGRALAPHVKHIDCLDLTPAMLAQGQSLAKEAGLSNIAFVTGDAGALPYADESFDLIITRLSLHHFARPEVPFQEMVRVLKHGGKLVIWDMVATEEALRDTDDAIERMRDPSHTRILSRQEFEALFHMGCSLQTEEVTLVPVNLQSWMNLTDTPMATQATITALFRAELEGGKKTGFFPYEKDGQIFFDHRWLLLIGIRQ